MESSAVGSGRRGFTLIELLVVIAIIAVIAAILLPLMAKAREAGRRASCSAQMSEIVKALRMYADDSNGRLPWATAWWDIDPNWTGDGFVDSTFIGLKLAAYTKSSGSTRNNVFKLWKCPSFPDLLRDLNVTRRNSVYYYNIFCPYPTLAGVTIGSKPAQIAGQPIDGPYDFGIDWMAGGKSWINTRPSRMVILWDQRYQKDPDHWSPEDYYLVHFDGWNDAYLDGHVKFHFQTDRSPYEPE